MSTTGLDALPAVRGRAGIAWWHGPSYPNGTCATCSTGSSSQALQAVHVSAHTAFMPVVGTLDASTATIVGLVGVVLGAALTALLTRRNERLSHADELLAQATNDAIDAIANVAAGTAHDSQARYASAVSRIALHGSPHVVATWRRFQDDATSETDDGRSRLVAAVQSVREQLGHGNASAADLRVLMFGPGGPRRQRKPRS
jgi:hypothetical protein